MLAAFIVSILSPLTFHFSIAPGDHISYMVALDVCDASGGVMSAGSEAPALHECSSNPKRCEFAGLIEAAKPSFLSSLFSVQIERPPRV